MPDSFRFQFGGLFDGPFDAAVQRDDVSVEQDAVVSRYGHGRYQRLLQPFPFGFDPFRIPALLVGVYIVHQNEVRPEVLVTRTAR